MSPISFIPQFATLFLDDHQDYMTGTTDGWRSQQMLDTISIQMISLWQHTGGIQFCGHLYAATFPQCTG
jgi:hypothetical protein